MTYACDCGVLRFQRCGVTIMDADTVSESEERLMVEAHVEDGMIAFAELTEAKRKERAAALTRALSGETGTCMQILACVYILVTSHYNRALIYSCSLSKAVSCTFKYTKRLYIGCRCR
jgi:hypothetical protein